MDAGPILRLVARMLAVHRLEAVLIGNAAAALQGSPVTTLDLDFMFRKTPSNMKKLKAIADELDAMVMRPFYPASDLYRVVRDRDALQIDFMAKIDGVRSFERLRAAAPRIEFDGYPLLVASMRKKKSRRRKASALRRESERNQLEQIRRLLALEPSRRTQFLRARVPFRGSSV
jgi:hypothetical protein